MKKSMTVQEAAHTLDAIRPLLESNGLAALQSYFDECVEEMTESVFYDAEMLNADAIKIRACTRNTVKKNWHPAKLATDLKRKCENVLDKAQKKADNAETTPIYEGI